MSSLVRWLKWLFGFGARSQTEDAQPSGFKVMSLAVEALSSDLEVVAHGQKNGTANIPPSDATIPDGYEARIESEVVKRVEKARARAGKLIRDLETSIKARQLAPAVKRCGEIPDAFVRERGRRASRLESDRMILERELSEVRREVEAYRSRHRVQRTVRITAQEDRYSVWVFLIAFTFVQFLANAILFGEGSDYGFSLGISLALVFAFFDITLHFVLGDLSARIQAPDRVQRSIGIVSTLGWVSTVALVNLSMVHLRLVTRTYGIGGWERWLESIRESTFGFDDFLSWALLAVGVMCSLLAVRSGFTWDEPIPLLRRNERRAMRLREDLEDVREEQDALTSELLKKYERELDGIDRQAENHVSIVSDSKNRIDQVIAEFKGHCVDARSTLNALVRMYRDENRRNRSEPTPAFFREPVSFEVDATLDASLESLRQVLAQSERDHEELRVQLPEARRLLQDHANRRHGEPVGQE